IAGVSAVEQALYKLIHPRTAAEISAGVTPVDYRYPELNVLRYGVNTTPGTTDMTEAIQTAIDVARQKGGGVVFLPNGTYLVTASVAVKSNVTLMGEGRTSIIKTTSAAPSIMGRTQSNVVVRALQALGDGDSLKQQQRGIQ